MPQTRKQRKGGASGTSSTPKGGAAANKSMSAEEIQECRDELATLYAMNVTLLDAICSHPQFNESAPDTSPTPLWHTATFVRRTSLQYLAPLCPPGEPVEPGSPDAPPASAWPRFDFEKYSDALSRSFVISNLILDPSKQEMIGVTGKDGFDFGPVVRDMARHLKAQVYGEDLEPEELETLAGMTEEEIEGLRKKGDKGSKGKEHVPATATGSGSGSGTADADAGADKGPTDT